MAAYRIGDHRHRQRRQSGAVGRRSGAAFVGGGVVDGAVVVVVGDGDAVGGEAVGSAWFAAEVVSEGQRLVVAAVER